MKQVGATLAVLLLVSTTPARAYRPFDGTDADVAAPREVELEIGPVGYVRADTARSLVAPSLVLNYGFAPRLEAVLEGRQRWVLSPSSPPALDDVALSVKSLLREGTLQGESGISLALETGVLLPGSTRRLGAHVASILSWRVPALTLHLNLGNDLLTSVRYAASSSLIVEGPERWRVRPVGEVLVERDFGERSLARGLGASMLIGAVASWSEAWSFDLAIRRGYTDGVTEDELRGGLTWAFQAW
jgi:hypothetical protein